ncbi:hypothetical protein [Ochrobactrum quorumnocens]|jgi:hypothetical protein|uniref:Uncharacterized protein n=1 Tax=Ochrobactrum quorumnocens TaxID=271865 RepID=A0A248UEI7_9HYPH|nr:hypothetical protein [[Ochrobactrum] quorumnocens]ASV84950.1 hypothetical protein CES85_5754 [[Ochrobactrum] quorumnocens]KAA9368797.1 hypothetical protein F3W84_07975 [[Ochrobactrum] quorumnocens]MBD7990498.1 hypothetical protein [Ochrobactrum gallinarum]
MTASRRPSSRQHSILRQFNAAVALILLSTFVKGWKEEDSGFTTGCYKLAFVGNQWHEGV